MFRFLLFWGFTITFWSCTTTQIPSSSQARNKNFIYLYAPPQNLPYPRVLLYNNNDEETTVFLRFQKQSLTFFHNQQLDQKECGLEIVTTVIPSFKNQLLLDSTSHDVFFQEDTSKPFYETFFSIRTPKQYSHFVVTVKIKNKITQQIFYNFYTLDKEHINTPQNFIFQTPDKHIHYTCYASTKDTFIVHHRQEEKHSTVFISYRSKPYHPALLPYSLLNYKPPTLTPDTTIIKQFGDTIFFQKAGIYFFQTDTLANEGYLLLVTDTVFPHIKRPIQLLEPLEYLTSIKEYKLLKKAHDKKTAIDAFWLEIGKSPIRARTLIQAYYNRVLLSNLLFTSNKEGWKTDRGMIYIIFGRPKYVYRSENLEKWIYGDPSTSASLSFLFEKRNSKYCHNCWILDRQDSYETPWNQAIRIWRQGHIYSVF